MSAVHQHAPPSYAEPLLAALRAARCAKSALDAAASAPVIAKDSDRAKYALTLAVHELEKLTGGLLI